MFKRKIIGVVTGSRAEYGYLRPLLKKLSADPAVKLKLYVCGLHLVKNYGHTFKEIVTDGFEIAGKVDMKMKDENTPFDLTISIAAGVEGFAKVFKNDKPDILTVFGDRIEPFAAAIAAISMDIPLAHINGGDAALGDIDNNLRHAITKLAHLHFTASRQSRQRVLNLGEESWRVFQPGALSLDTILNQRLLSKTDLCKKYVFSDKPFILVSYQPVTTEWLEAGKQIRLILQSAVGLAKKENMSILAVYPNPYPGGYNIIRVIQEIARENNNIFVFKNFPHLEFISLMAVSSVFVGNSSSGIIEAPSLAVPYVSVGTRQKGRERGDNVIEASYNKSQIETGIKKALFDKKFLALVKKKASPYGDGQAAAAITKILKKIKINKRLLQKKITY